MEEKVVVEVGVSGPSEKVDTASFVKVNIIPNAIKPTDATGFCFIMDISCLNALIANLHCPSCCMSSLSVNSDPTRRMGCSLELSVTCAACGYNSEGQHTSKRIDEVFEVNRRLVYAMRQI